MFCIIAVASITILTGTSCVYTDIYLQGVGAGPKGMGAVLTRPTPAFDQMCGCRPARGLPSASQPRAHGQWWLPLPRSALGLISLLLLQEGQRGLGQSFREPMPSALSRRVCPHRALPPGTALPPVPTDSLQWQGSSLAPLPGQG